jgi:hypothetical protein
VAGQFQSDPGGDGGYRSLLRTCRRRFWRELRVLSAERPAPAQRPRQEGTRVRLYHPEAGSSVAETMIAECGIDTPPRRLGAGNAVVMGLGSMTGARIFTVVMPALGLSEPPRADGP